MSKAYYAGEKREPDPTGHACTYYGDLLGSVGGFPCDVGFRVSRCFNCGYELHTKAGPEHVLYCTPECFRALAEAGRIALVKPPGASIAFGSAKRQTVSPTREARA